MAISVTYVLVAVPPNIRHALTRWMIEPAPGVFIGTISAKVRDELWTIIRQETWEGWALMVHPSANEQGFTIETTGVDRRSIVDFDGVQLASMQPMQLENRTEPF